jgi:hypothetical protein
MRKISLLALLALAIISSCSDETTIYSDPAKEVSVEDSQTVLDNSISFENAGVLDIIEQDQLTGKFSKSAVDGAAGDYPLTVVAQVAPPSFSGGANLTASHVDVVDNFAYVAYNTVGAEYVGAIDIVNVSDPNNPKVTSRLYFENADVNALKYDNGYVYAVGGVDAEKSITATSNSFVAKIEANSGVFNLGAGVQYGFQQGFNANDIKIVSNKLMVTSGRDGSITVYDKNSMAILQEAPFSDLRALAQLNNIFAVLDASKGVSILDQNLQVTKEISISSDFGASSKRTLDFYKDNIVVSEGAKGAGVYNYSTGNFVEYIPIMVDPAGVESSDIVTNAVAANDGILLMANGGAGLCLSEDGGNNTNLVGVLALEGSINYVASKGDYVFAASGKKGLQIVKLNKPQASLVARCSASPLYVGSANLKVGSLENLNFSGSKSFNTLEVNGSLLLCGTWTVKEDVKINTTALFEMNGTLAVGNNKRRRDIIVGKNATFRVEGNLNIYGDLILEEGSTLEFLGTSVVNIFGKVDIKDPNVLINGNFVDVRNVFP